MDLYERRKLLSNSYLTGQGLEIGAGASPHGLPIGAHALFFDVRGRGALSEHFGTTIGYEVHDLQEIPRYFPRGADFLIAHHVLEHTPDPIGTLRQWHRYLRPGGTVVLTLPYFKFCPDRGRLLPSLEHLLLDHLLARDGDSFESKEHVLSFLCSWADDAPALVRMEKREAIKEMLANLHRSGHDFHWHAYDHSLTYNVILSAALLDHRPCDFLYNSCTELEKDQTLDMLFVYQLSAEDPLQLASANASEAYRKMITLRKTLIDAAECLSNLPA